MKSYKFWGAALTAALALSGVVGVVAATSASGAIPPISPVITSDPNANKGFLTFYDASGQVMTSGTNLTQLFTYAAASSAGRPGTTKATVFFAFPDHTQTDSQNWFSNQATTPATFPIATAPAPVNTLTTPVAKTGAGDANLEVMLPTTIQDHTAGFDGILQVRLFDSGPGISLTPNFWATDIFYDAAAHTWQQVFPAPPSGATATSTTLGVTPAGHAAPGTTVTLTATVTPNTAVGAVQFKDGATNIGTPIPVSGGTATVASALLVTGALTAVFIPTDSTKFATSTSNTVNYVIANVPAAPSGVGATAGHAAATVSWTAPANGGAAITGYDVQYSSDAGATWTSGSATFHTSTATTQTVTGLLNGTSYVFRVAAINAIGTGSYSPPSAAVTPVPAPAADPSALTISRSTTIRFGAATRITTRLTDARTHAGIGGALVTLSARPNRARPFVKLRTIRTGPAGGAVTAVAPRSRTFYRWTYAASPAHAAAASPAEIVSVSQVVSIAAKPATVVHGRRFAVYGTVSPAVGGQRVVLQLKVGPNRYRNVAVGVERRQRLPNGVVRIGYVFSVLEGRRGLFTLRVTRAATPVLSAGASRLLTVRAL